MKTFTAHIEWDPDTRLYVGIWEMTTGNRRDAWEGVTSARSVRSPETGTSRRCPGPGRTPKATSQ